MSRAKEIVISFLARSCCCEIKECSDCIKQFGTKVCPCDLSTPAQRENFMRRVFAKVEQIENNDPFKECTEEELIQLFAEEALNERL